MPLQLSKLQELLAEKGFVISKYFVLNKEVVYLEIFSVKMNEMVMLYIPSKYNFNVDSGGNVYKLSKLDLPFIDNVSDAYGEKDSSKNRYNIELDMDSENDNMEDHLDKNYKNRVNFNEKTFEDLRTIQRQMKRLRYSVENVDYKLAIIYKNYLCTIKKDNVICFTIKHYPEIEMKRLFVVVNLETLFSKGSKILEDIYVVRESIYYVLEKNQGITARLVAKIMENKQGLLTLSNKAELKKAEYERLLLEAQTMLKKMNQAEKRVMEKLYLLQDQNNSSLHTDINRVHNKSLLEKELNSISTIKAEISKNMNTLRIKRENTLLNIDKIMYDNTVMLDTVLKNFEKMSTLF